MRLRDVLCRRFRDDDGVAYTVFVVLMMSSFLLLMGFTFDGAQVFLVRREMAQVASASARAGAQDIKVGAYLAHEEFRLRKSSEDLATAFAEAAGADWSSAQILDGDYFDSESGVYRDNTVSRYTEALEVRVRRRYSPVFIGPIVGDQLIYGRGKARPVDREAACGDRLQLPRC